MRHRRAGAWTAILCADWSKDRRKREVYAASPGERRVWRADPPASGWDVAEVLNAAARIRGCRRGPALIGFDAPIGVPRSFLEATGSRSFLGWLQHRRSPDAFELCRSAGEWSARQPFFHVPKGRGSKQAFYARMRHLGVEPVRAIDRQANAKSPFIAAGIPGSVGSSVIDLWRDLSRCRRRVAIWPFDGPLEGLRRERRPVVVEIYPRVAYALALSESPSHQRTRLAVAKTRSDVRAAYLAQMLAAEGWMRRLGVDTRNVEEAKDSEDAFDALVAAAGLLRCVLERTRLSDDRFEDRLSEGGILGSGSVRLDLPERTFRP